MSTELTVQLMERLTRSKTWRIPGWTLGDVRPVGPDDPHVEVVYTKDGTSGPDIQFAAYLVNARTVAQAYEAKRFDDLIRALLVQHDAFRSMCHGRSVAETESATAQGTREAGW